MSGSEIRVRSPHIASLHAGYGNELPAVPRPGTERCNDAASGSSPPEAAFFLSEQ